MEFIDWNEFTLDQHCEILEEKFRFSSAGEAKSIFELIKFYRENKVKEISSKVLVSGSFPYSIYEEELNKINQLPQTQTSLMKQCEILRIFANKLGLYDAADFLRNDR